MSEAKIIFTLDGINLTIQCTLEDKIKDICQKYSTKIDNKINTLIFLYGGCQMNMELKFKEQANSIDKNNKEMRVLVYKKENEDFMCPNCGIKINLNKNKINDIILCNNKLKESINGIKFNIENLINISTNNIISSQLKNINVIINAINEDINRNNDRITSLFNEDINISNENIIKGVSDIKLNEKTNNSNQILNNINIQPPNKLNLNLNGGRGSRVLRYSAASRKAGSPRFKATLTSFLKINLSLVGLSLSFILNIYFMESSIMSA